MQIWGISLLDVGIIVAYVIGMLWIGKLVGKGVKDEGDFYLAGRKLGKFLQFFLNFGAMTDANGSASTASVVFQQGVGGIWIAMQTLFMTPYYWFMNLWFRRVRLITMADLYTDRFGGKFLGAYYSIFNLMFGIFLIGWGYVVSCKTMEAVMIKQPAQYTAQEEQMVADYSEYKVLQQQYNKDTLPSEELARYETLSELSKTGKIKPFVSYVNPLVFYLLYAAIIGIYIVMGGFGAAAITNAVQGILIIIFSLMLIPMGLSKLGGFSGLHDSVPDYMFRLFGGGSGSEFTWFSILAILFVSWVQIHGLAPNMAVGGSAKDEFAARLGPVTGGFCKRLMIIAWALCALIAVGLFGGQINDPDLTWGVLTYRLLPVGLIGLMIAGILAANMSSMDGLTISLSALFVRNIYSPLFPGRPQKHYVLVARVTIVALLLSGIFIALYSTGVISLLKSIIAMNVTFGAPTLLLFFWRRLTKTAVVVEVIAVTVAIVLLPYIIPVIPALANSEKMTVYTQEQKILTQAPANKQDVEAGKAKQEGEMITRTEILAPAPLYFEKVSRIDPYDQQSPLRGHGRFKVEIYVMDKLGLNVSSMTPAGLMTTRFIFDGILPFIILFLVSPFTRKTDKQRLDRFYVKMKTPIGPTPEMDQQALQLSYENPARFDGQKLFPKSNWEMCRWDKVDTFGFIFCWGVVAFILLVLWAVFNIGS